MKILIEVGMVEIKSQSPFLVRAIRFSITGIFVTGVHIAVATLLVKYFDLLPPLANGVAFTVATLMSYLINTLWSFSERLRGRTLFRFAAVSIFGFCLAILISWMVQKLGFTYMVGICAVAIIMPPTTFVLHNFWTYKNRSL